MEELGKRRIVNVVLVASIVAAGAVLWAGVRKVMTPAPAPVVVRAPAPAAPSPKPAANAPAPVIVETPAAQPAPVVVVPQVTAPQPVVPQPRVARPQPAPQPFTPDAPPDPRTALASVGKDPAADRVWIASINDTTNVPAKDRKNLIEDLNETGFDDPKNLTASDLPLINNRIALIEQLYQGAADDTNAAAFDEAYKDLLNMRTQLTGQ